MKNWRIFRIKFWAQMSVIAVLGMTGVLALCAEPADLLAFADNLIGWSVMWLAAWLLYRHWGLDRIINRIKSIN